VNTTDWYVELMVKFVNKCISGVDFEKLYIEKRSKDIENNNCYNAIVDEFFIDIDLYCSDKDLFVESDDINEEELRRRCVMALSLLLKE